MVNEPSSHTLWQFHITMEHHHFQLVIPLYMAISYVKLPEGSGCLGVDEPFTQARALKRGAGDIPILRIWLYIFGCVALEFITTDPELLADHATASIVKENFGSLPKATLTLLQAGNSRKIA